jgi:hypothetical protein
MTKHPIINVHEATIMSVNRNTYGLLRVVSCILMPLAVVLELSMVSVVQLRRPTFVTIQKQDFRASPLLHDMQGSTRINEHQGNVSQMFNGASNAATIALSSKLMDVII